MYESIYLRNFIFFPTPLSLGIWHRQMHSLEAFEYLQTLWKRLTNLDTSRFPLSSFVAITSLSAAGRTFQNSITNSFPLRLLFCMMSFARYKRGILWTTSDLSNCFFHVETTCSALLRLNIHQCDKAISKVNDNYQLRINK